MLRSTKNSPIAAAACNKTLCRWCPQALRPNSWQSSMCDIIASGYHSPAGPLVSAQRTLSAVSPARTWGERTTKMLSS